MNRIVAIDGPAGAGKSTAARRTALALNMAYLDTGGMYRAIAWLAASRKVDHGSEAELACLTRSMRLEMGPLTKEGAQRIEVEGTEVTLALRTPAVTQLSSQISALPAVRREAVQRQRALALQHPEGAVLEGRDIGTAVFPDAAVKIFLTASPKVRAQRRLAEMHAKGIETTLQEVLRAQSERDLRDSTRDASPLHPAPDAEIISTDTLDMEAVVQKILQICRSKLDIS